MAAIVSVQRFTIAIGTGSLSNTAALAGGTVTANCVPFVTNRVTTVDPPNQQGFLGNYQVNARFSGSNIEVHRDRTGTSCAVEVEVAVVEFDSAKVDVQQDVLQLTSGGSFDLTDTVVITTVDQTAAFLVSHHYQNSGIPQQWRSHLVRGLFSANNKVTHNRDVGDGTNDGNFYVAEATAGDFSVQSLSIAVTGTSNTGTLGTTIDPDKTFLVGSVWADTTTDANEDNTYIVELESDGSTVTVTRKGTDGTLNWHGFAITIAEGKVQRGTISAQGATASQDVTIDAVDLDYAMAVHAGNNGNVVGGAFPSAVDSATGPNDDKPDALVTLELVNTTTLRVKHSTGGGEADNDISWEVVEWAGYGSTPATPRRVMVIT